MSKKHRQVSALGGRFCEERKRRGWRQQDVAEEMGNLHFELTGEVIHLNEEMVGRWERGEHNISPHYRQLLCKLFGISDEEQSLLISKDYNNLKKDI